MAKLTYFPGERVSIISRLLAVIRWKRIRMSREKTKVKQKKTSSNLGWKSWGGEGIINGEKGEKVYYGQRNRGIR